MLLFCRTQKTVGFFRPFIIGPNLSAKKTLALMIIIYCRLPPILALMHVWQGSATYSHYFVFLKMYTCKGKI